MRSRSVPFFARSCAIAAPRGGSSWCWTTRGTITERRQVLSLSFLPPYSPELNPIERVWKLARKLCTHNQYFPVLADLVTAVSAQLELWRQPNPVLARLCGII
jgi:hypothetical protein